MKPRSLRNFPQTLVVCIVPLLSCASASAQILDFNEASAPTGNLNTVWTLPGGTNLLSLPGNVVTPATPATREGSSGSWATLTDGDLGTPGNNTTVVTPNNNDSVTYALDLTSNPGGYDITAFDSYATWGDSGRDNQNYSFQVSTDGVNFSTVAVVNNSDSPANKATHTSVTEASGVLATGVTHVRIVFGSPVGQENGYVGMSEFKVVGTPTNVLTLLESSNSTGSFTLPAGANLLNGSTATATPPITQTALSTLTNGLLGEGSDHASSVAPDNNTAMIFPLNTTVNFNGYNISSIDTYAAWANSGRDNQNLSISYSVVGAESVFIPLGNAVLRTSGDSATHVRLTPAAGFLATGVAAIKINTGHQENGFVGLREFIALGTAVSLADPLTWTGGSGSAGNANWVTSADNNWKKTIGGAASNFNPLAALTFDSLPTNRNITVPAPLTASSMAFTNDASHPYTFGGGLVTVSNDIASSGNGSATFNNEMKTSTGVALSGSGSLVFNGALESAGISLAGPGGITLNAANPALTGSASVSDGTLTVSHNNGLQSAGLSMTGGTALFTSSAPLVGSISSAIDTGSVILGNTIGPVNTNLSVGDAASVTTFGGPISQDTGTVGRLTKDGTSTLILQGENTYTGATTVNGGTLQIDLVRSLYNGVAASWTTGNLIVGSGGTLTFKVGGDSEFTEANINDDVALGGFASGSFFGLSTTTDVTLSRNLTQPGLGLVKSGPGILNLTGSNTSNGVVKVFNGALNAAGTGGPAINGNVVMGNTGTNVTLNMGGNDQLAATSVITFTNGNFYDSKINLRGTSQTVAGLDSAPFPLNKVPLIQNDEIGQPGYTDVSGPASLTINATTDHSFYGLIRDQDGGVVSVIKNGPGTQEFQNSYLAGYSYSGPTTINEGTLRLNFAGGTSGFGSNITVAAGARLEFNAIAGDYNFDRELHGPGQIAATGINALRFTNPANSFTGGLTIGSPAPETYNGFVALVAQNGVVQGAGNGPGQTCIGGAMTPSNVITVQGGATLALDGIGPLGESSVLPDFAPSIVVNNSGLRGGGLAFVANLTLNNAEVTVGNGIVIAGFDTSLAFVGTVTVGGDSNQPSTINTPAPGPSANASLGSAGLPGTVFDVADVTSSSDSDLIVGSILRNVNNVASPLVKTGLGTMELQAVNTYTGKTHVMEGELRVNTASLADAGNVEIDAAGTLHLPAATVDTVSRLTLAGTGMPLGIYGSTTNITPGITQTPRITGPGMLLVSNNPVTSYETWSLAIPNAADRDRTDDPDGDGFSNLQEFLFGTSPIAATGTLSSVEDTGSTLIIRWSERLGSDSIYVLQESTTLESPWPTSGAIPTTDANQTGLYSVDYVRKQAIIPINNDRKFARVSATE